LKSLKLLFWGNEMIFIFGLVWKKEKKREKNERKKGGKKK
jgi:hypothetical protein